LRKIIARFALLVLGLLLQASASGAELTAPAKGQASLPPAAKPETDTGQQDPADFFRPPGLVRKSYSAATGAIRNEEIATYHTGAGLDETVALYRDGLPAAGWQQQSDSDSGSGANRLRMIEWQKPAKEAEIRFYGAKSGTDLRVRVFTYKTATLAKSANEAPLTASTMVVVPNVVDKGTRQAETMLGEMQLKFQYGPPKIDPVSAPVERATVAEQSPATGQRVASGSTVILTPWIGSVVVPNVVEKLTSVAESMLTDKRLKFAYGPPKVDPVPAPDEKGTVAEQSPAAGQTVPKGATITLTAWRGSAVVPDVVGKLTSAAESMLTEKRLKFQYGPRKVDPVPAPDERGTVAEQSPAAGQIVPKDTTVTLTGWIGSFVVPDLVGKATQVAESTLEQRHIRFQYGPPKVDPVPSPYERGSVAEQSPAAGQTVPKDTTVILTPWVGSAVVPNVVGKLTSMAESMLFDKRLKFEYGPPKVDPVPAPDERGTVAEQSPAAGQTVVKGSTVTLTRWVGSMVVPNLVGQQMEQAEMMLRDRGARKIEWAPPRLSADRKLIGTVAEQNPAAGQTVAKNSTITLTGYKSRID
jgi:beta-lactam-binding protein with PASTA domain